MDAAEAERSGLVRRIVPADDLIKESKATALKIAEKSMLSCLAIKESINLIASAGANVTGIIVGLDRKEKGLTKYSAIQEIQRDYEIPIVSIVDIDDIIQHVARHESSKHLLSNISEYREKFGVD